jgi:hypothetical protein
MKPGDLVDMTEWQDSWWMLEKWVDGTVHQILFDVPWERGDPAMILRIDDEWCELLVPQGQGWIPMYLLRKI